jgi:predicted nucleic acid-binding protein
VYLVDTSVWVDFLRGRETPCVGLLDELLGDPLAVGLSDAILMEILQGARDQRAFDRFRRYFGGLPCHRFADPQTAHVAAAQLFLDCRRAGVTVRSSVDCLVAQCAIENDLVLLHNDRDFAKMAPVRDTLRQRHFLD